MATISQRLLKTPRFKSDESFMGYILRLAEENGHSTPQWIINLAKFNNLLPNCSFTSTSSESFKLLASLSGSTVSELEEITYPPVGIPSYNFHLFFGVPVHRSFIQPRHPKICPECLREAAYCRRVWEFVLITACPVHKCMLLDECPNCKLPIKSGRSCVSGCPCKFDWREAAVSTAQDHEVSLARVIHWLCGLSQGEERHYFSQKNPAFKLSLQDFAYAVIFMAGQLRGLSLTTIWPLLSIVNVKDFHHLFTGAYYIFDAWPKHFYEFLDWWCANKRAANTGYQRLHSVLYKDFGKLYTGLYKKLYDSQFDFIRDAFVDYLNNRWEGCDLSSFALNKETGDFKVKYVSKSDVRRLLDADDEWINHSIQMGTLKTKVRSKGMKRLIFIDIVDIAKLMRNC